MKPYPFSEDRGIALIIVLGVVSMFTFLSTMLIGASKISGISSKVNVDRSRAKYSAESALAYAQWMVISYNFDNPDRDLFTGEGEETWFADGMEHSLKLPNVNANVRIFDAFRGWNIRTLNKEKNRMINRYAIDGEPGEETEYLEEFFAVFADYTDRDDFLKHPKYGMEEDEYADIGLEGFPRNNPMEFREEIYWIKNIEYLTPGLRTAKPGALPENLFQVIPPKGIRQPRNARTSFWSAPMAWLDANTRNGLTKDEMGKISECRSKGFDQDQSVLSECLGLELYTSLKSISGLSFDPRSTSVYTIEATGKYADAIRRVVGTIDLKNLTTQTGKSKIGKVITLTYWQKVFY